jgi:crossover junction endodeoxyribonuclease RuvC
MRVIGVDPGLQKTGYAVVERKGKGYRVITSGVIRTKKDETGKRLLSIFDSISSIIEENSPTCLSIESSFYSKNIDSLVKMSQVKGVVVVAACIKGLEVFEYSPTSIKSAVVGSGRARKEQVKFMVEQMIDQKIDGSYDISDAFAVALCHLHRSQ